jgi:hypothetical protein
MLKNFVKEFQNNSPSLRKLRSRRILEPTRTTISASSTFEKTSTEVNGITTTTKATTQCQINSNIDKP